MFLHFVLLFNGKETETPNGERKGQGERCKCMLLYLIVCARQATNQYKIQIKNLNAKIDISIFFSI